MNDPMSPSGASDKVTARKPLTLAENVILTAKVLAGVGVLAAGIWAIDSFIG